MAIKQGLTLGLMMSGCEVVDIRMALSPSAYFAQFELDAPCVAMVTASHNENGWTGVKMGAQPPLTFGPDLINRLKEIIFTGKGVERPGGKYTRVERFRARYVEAISAGHKLSRPVKCVVATGNGTAYGVAPEPLKRMGADVVGLHNKLHYTFPNYNPNPEDMKMLHDVSRAVKESGAEIGLAFDGDGDRCGFVDDKGHEVFADKI